MSSMSADAPVDTFVAGDRVRYWSVGNTQWVLTHVQKVNRGASGKVTSYDLSVKARACIERVRRAPTPPVWWHSNSWNRTTQKVATEVAPPVTPQKASRGDAQRQKGSKAGTDDRVAKNKVAAHQPKQAPLARGKGAASTPKKPVAGVKKTIDKVETKARWLATRWQTRHGAKDSVSDSGGGSAVAATPPRRSRTRSGDRSDVTGVMPANVSSGQQHPPKPLAGASAPAKGFQVGDHVDYFSESKARWVATVVTKIVVREGKSTTYNLSCKLGVSAKSMRCSTTSVTVPATPDKRFEYYSHSRKRWLKLSAKVGKRSPSPCQVDPYL